MVDIINAGFPTSLFRMEVGTLGILVDSHIGGRCLVLRANAGGSGNNIPIAVIFGKFREDDKIARPYWVHANELDDGWGSANVVVYADAKIRLDNSSLLFVKDSNEDPPDSSMYMVANRPYLKALPVSITGDRGNFLLSGRMLQRNLPGPTIAYKKWSVILPANESGSSEETIFII